MTRFDPTREGGEECTKGDQLLEALNKRKHLQTVKSPKEAVESIEEARETEEPKKKKKRRRSKSEDASDTEHAAKHIKVELEESDTINERVKVEPGDKIEEKEEKEKIKE